MQRTFTFTVGVTIEDPSVGADLSDEALGDAEDAAVEAARAAIVARYPDVDALVADADVAEDLD